MVTFEGVEMPASLRVILSKKQDIVQETILHTPSTVFFFQNLTIDNHVSAFLIPLFFGNQIGLAKNGKVLSLAGAVTWGRSGSGDTRKHQEFRGRRVVQNF